MSITDTPFENLSPKHRPLFPVLFGFAFGIAVQHFSPLLVTVLLLLFISSAAISLFILKKETGKTACWLCAFMIFMIFGGLWYNLRYQSLPPCHIANLLSNQNRLMRLKGKVRQEPRIMISRYELQKRGQKKTLRWLLRVETEQIKTGENKWLNTAGGITMFGSGELPDINYGDRIEFLAGLRANSPPTNPGEPDMAGIYRRSGSYGTASGVTSAGIKILERIRWYRSPRTAVERIRSRVRAQMTQNNGGKHVHPLAQALMLGDRHVLPADLSRQLENAGAMHFLAISGLHVGIFAAGLWMLLTLTGVPAGKKHLLLIALIWGYVLFTGTRTSSIRAAIMVSMLVGAPLLHRNSDPLSSLSGAAFFILLWRPQELFSIGFHFTFLAVWALSFLYPRLRKIIWPWRETQMSLQSPEETTLTEKIWVHGSDYFLLSFSVWLVITPLTAMNFHRYSLILPLLNLLLWPLVLLLLFCCFLSLLFLPIGGFLFNVMNYFSSLFAGGIEGLLSFFENLPGFVRHTPGPPFWWVVLYFALLITWLSIQNKKYKNKIVLYGTLFLLLSLFFFEINAGKLENFQITVKDIGHGQCIIMRLPEGGVLMHDAGSPSQNKVKAAAGVLWYNRIRHIDALVVSHRHFDHYSLLPELAEKFPISKLLIPPKGVGERVDKRVERALYEAGDQYIKIKKDTKITGGLLRGKTLHPDLRFLSEKDIRRNDRSAVILFEYKGRSILLPGDAEEQALKRLLSNKEVSSINADILLLPHHGAWAPIMDEFLEAVSPKIAIASNGRELSHRMRDMLNDKKIPTWTTYKDGAIILDFQSDGINIEGFSSGRRQTILGNSLAM